jgi:hypothetical protein
MLAFHNDQITSEFSIYCKQKKFSSIKIDSKSGFYQCLELSLVLLRELSLEQLCFSLISDNLENLLFRCPK